MNARAHERLRGTRWELTQAGVRALERETEIAARRACAWCGEEIAEGEAVTDAGAGRLLHETPSCRLAFEVFTTFTTERAD